MEVIIIFAMAVLLFALSFEVAVAHMTMDKVQKMLAEEILDMAEEMAKARERISRIEKRMTSNQERRLP